MPPLAGFSDNPFRSRDDILRAASSLLKPLTLHKSTCGARIKIPIATGTGFDEISAQLEGFARPLWVVADLLSLRAKASEAGDQASDFQELDLDSWVRGLYAGVDPESESFWGHLGNHDQRMVEMEPIAYALLSAPEIFSLGPVEDEEKMQSLKSWLSSINEKVMPPSNWRWFRVLVNLALIKFCQVPYEEVKKIMDTDFEVLDSCYIGEGWSSDGVWSEDKKQVDYYSGSFAIQYSQLAYVRFANDIDPERVERYRKQARDFSKSFWRYFDVNGAAIPFGRSLTYRFTFAAFWSAVVVAGIDLPPPLDDLGVVKGLLLRHFRWWAKHPDFLNVDGTLSIGYVYPNMYMGEDYNSPQSTYWCLKTFSVLGLPEDHPFWCCEELPHPLSDPNEIELKSHKSDLAPRQIGVVSPAMHIICSFPEHHFLLSSGQFTKKMHKAREAKYGKFSYSSSFAFSVPIGNTLEQMAPDSTLSVSNDDGESWKVRWDPQDAQIRKLRSSSASLVGQNKTIPVLSSKWNPWRTSGLQIESILIPPSSNWPGWHVRIHKLSFPAEEVLDIECVDAGFAILSQTSKGGVLPTLMDYSKGSLAVTEGVLQDATSSFVLSDAGACGVFHLSIEAKSSVEIETKGFILKPDANTNLIAQRTLIPTIRRHISSASGDGTGKKIDAWFATGIFAIASSSGFNSATVKSMWNRKPGFSFRKPDASVWKLGQEEGQETWEIDGLWDHEA